jgi:hypothetical protein
MEDSKEVLLQLQRHPYSFTDMPGALLVNTLGRGWFPTPNSKATEPTTTKMSVITVPAINTNGLNPPGHVLVSRTATPIDPQRTRSRPPVRTCPPPNIDSDPPNLEWFHTHR